ncbi:MAG: M48 family metalloprotease [Bacteroidetes bacterium]|jgi:predicted Zn-dependent protease|nr:M48 family metalloprotease [Bacteroidota bacterium]
MPPLTNTTAAMRSLVSLRRIQAVLAIALVAVLAAGCVVQTNPISGNQRAYGYTWEQEVQLGQEADQQIVQQYGVYDNDALRQYVSRIGQEVLAESHLRRPDADPKFKNTEFTFRVLDSPIVNAFALPGGYVYVTRGLMSHLNNEAQLAVVLGHEVTHVAGRHASKRAAKQQFAQIGLIGGAILGQEVLGGAAGEGILNLGGTAAQLMLLKYGRDDERESDKYGVEYAALAGYDASEGAAFFNSLERIQEQSGAAIPTWQSSHPDPGEREQTILQMASEWKQRAPATEVGQDAYYRVLEDIVLGENPRNGFVEDGAFYHPELRFQFPVPPSYQVQNTPAQVILVEPNQQAIMSFSFAQENTADAAARAFAGQEGLQVVDSGSERINGNPARYVLADAQTQQGTLRVLTYFIEHGGNVYGFLGYAAQQNFDQYAGTFRQSMRGFDDLTDPSILNVEPSRLNVVQATRTAPFRDFVPAQLPEQFTPDGLAILNQVQLDEMIQQGRPLKLPR